MTGAVSAISTDPCSITSTAAHALRQLRRLIEVHVNKVDRGVALLYIHRMHPEHGSEAVVCIGYNALGFG